jgi:outer membrane protein W
MKKLTVMLLCMTVCGASLFAQGKGLFSAGGGVDLVPMFGTTKYKGGGDDVKTSGFGGGINAFFDAKYAEVNLGLLFASQKTDADGAKPVNTTNLTLGVLGKYPFTLSEKLSLFPFIGIDYLINLAATVDGEELEFTGKYSRAETLNALSLVFGVGADYDLTSALYLRGEIGFGITFNTKAESDNDAIDSNFKGKVPIKIAVGYRF